MYAVKVGGNIGPIAGTNSRGKFGGNIGNMKGSPCRGNIQNSQGMTINQPFLPYMASFIILDLNQVINHPLHHNPHALPMTINIQFYIPKLEGNP